MSALPLAEGVLWLPRISMTEERMFPEGWRHLSSAWDPEGNEFDIDVLPGA
jgi:hypothetical protein